MPPRYNETLGLQHCKVFVFDDSLIISGANLSSDYFTQRQDRYVVVESCPGLADYFDELITHVSDFSFQMDEKREFEMSEKWKWHPYKSKFDDFARGANEKLNTFIEREKAKNRLKDFSDDKFDTWIFPTLQMGLFKDPSGTDT